MCGIVALIQPEGLRGDDELIDRMRDALVHRGPDDAGSVVLASEGVALAMRRLSVLDHAGGRQPMWDEERQRCVVFNGEIYNFAALRRDLQARGHVFASDHSDTEVIVHGFEEWGLDLFPKLNGMFAIALWDRASRRLVVARDRAGEKPVFVARVPGGWAVASELKALFAHPEMDRAIDPVGVEQYLAFGYTIAPRTMLEQVTKLRPGHAAVIDADGYRDFAYWTPPAASEPIEPREAIERLDALLRESVELRMVADVPVGLFLSGGLDSSTIGWYMRQCSDRVRSFSVGFEVPRFDETRYSSLAARHIGTDHHVEILSSEKVASIIPRLPDVLDEPMGDSSVLPTVLLCEVARREVTVALGGDGSDELLLGYNAHQGFRVASLADRLPGPVRGLATGVAGGLPDRIGPARLKGLGWLAGRTQSPAARALTRLPDVRRMGGLERALLAPVQAALPPDVFAGLEALVEGDRAGAAQDERASLAFVRAYLPDDILVKVDRASMAASLEVRAPFLDHDLMDFALSVPIGVRMPRLRRKHLLREVMRDRLPTEIVDRSKWGFSPPIASWLRTSLRQEVVELLEPTRIAAGGLFDPALVQRSVTEFLDDPLAGAGLVWRLFQFELWRERWLTR